MEGVTLPQPQFQASSGEDISIMYCCEDNCLEIALEPPP